MPDNGTMRFISILAYSLFLTMPADAGAATRESVDTLFVSMQMDKSWDANMLAIRVICRSKSTCSPTIQDKASRGKNCTASAIPFSIRMRWV